MVFPVTIINNTTPQVSVRLDDAGQPTYAAFLNSLGNHIYKINKIYLYSTNFNQIIGVINYNRYDADGTQDYNNIVTTADPYQDSNGLYVDLTKYSKSFILNGNSSLSTTILPNTEVLVRFYCERVTNSFGMNKLNFDDLEKIFKPDFYKVFGGFELQRAMVLEDFPEHIQKRILEKRGIRYETLKKLPFNGVSESESKEPAIILSFASIMIGFYLLAKNE